MSDRRTPAHAAVLADLGSAILPGCSRAFHNASGTIDIWPPELAAADLRAAFGPVNTPAASPSETLSEAHDVYAVGCLAYEMLAPELPLNCVQVTADVLRRIAAGTAHAGGTSGVNPLRVSRAVAALWLWATATRMEDRPTAAELRRVIADMISEYVIHRSALRAVRATGADSTSLPGAAKLMATSSGWVTCVGGPSQCCGPSGGCGNGDEGGPVSYTEVLTLGRAARMHAPGIGADAVISAACIAQPGELLNHQLCGIVASGLARPDPQPFAGPLSLDLALWLDSFTEHLANPTTHAVAPTPGAPSAGLPWGPWPWGVTAWHIAVGGGPDGEHTSMEDEESSGLMAPPSVLGSRPFANPSRYSDNVLFDQWDDSDAGSSDGGDDVTDGLVAAPWQPIWVHPLESGESSGLRVASDAQSAEISQRPHFSTGRGYGACAPNAPMLAMRGGADPDSSVDIAAAASGSDGFGSVATAYAMPHACGPRLDSSLSNFLPFIWPSHAGGGGSGSATHLDRHAFGLDRHTPGDSGYAADESTCVVPMHHERMRPLREAYTAMEEGSCSHDRYACMSEGSSASMARSGPLCSMYQETAVLWRHVPVHHDHPQQRHMNSAAETRTPSPVAPPTPEEQPPVATLFSFPPPEETCELAGVLTLTDMPANRAVFDTCGISSEMESSSGSSGLTMLAPSSCGGASNSSSSEAAAAFGRMVRQSASATCSGSGSTSSVLGPPWGWGEAWAPATRPRRHVWLPMAPRIQLNRHVGPGWGEAWRGSGFGPGWARPRLRYGAVEVHSELGSEGISAAGPGFWPEDHSGASAAGDGGRCEESSLTVEGAAGETSAGWSQPEHSSEETEEEVRLLPCGVCLLSGHESSAARSHYID